jgi:hypothetical protein
LFRSSIHLVLVLILIQAAPAQETHGTVAGTVMDSQNGRPIGGVSVAINGITSDQNVTDSDGRFAIKLSPGIYTLRFSGVNYAPVELKDVSIKAGEVMEASTVLSNKSVVTTLDVVESIGTVDSTAAAMLTERKLSPVVSDSIGRDELAASSASEAAGALKQVTGVSVVGSGFVYVRGLGERYSSTQLKWGTASNDRIGETNCFPGSVSVQHDRNHQNRFAENAG